MPPGRKDSACFLPLNSTWNHALSHKPPDSIRSMHDLPDLMPSPSGWPAMHGPANAIQKLHNWVHPLPDIHVCYSLLQWYRAHRGAPVVLRHASHAFLMLSRAASFRACLSLRGAGVQHFLYRRCHATLRCASHTSILRWCCAMLFSLVRFARLYYTASVTGCFFSGAFPTPFSEAFASPACFHTCFLSLSFFFFRVLFVLYK